MLEFSRPKQKSPIKTKDNGGSSWGPCIGSPNGHGSYKCIDTTTAYLGRLEKVTKDQASRIIQLEEELEDLKREKSDCTMRLRAVSEEVPKLQTHLREKSRLLDSTVAVADDKMNNLLQVNQQLREDLQRFESEVLAAVRSGQADMTSVWHTTIAEVIELKRTIEHLTHENMAVHGDNGSLRARLEYAHGDMVEAVHRVHNLTVLNEPHQNFVENIMKERNYWQNTARKATRELDSTKMKVQEVKNEMRMKGQQAGGHPSPRRSVSARPYSARKAISRHLSPADMYGPP